MGERGEEGRDRGGGERGEEGRDKGRWGREGRKGGIEEGGGERGGREG